MEKLTPGHKLTIDHFKYDGINYTFYADDISIAIEPIYEGYNVALYGSDQRLLQPRQRTDTPYTAPEILFRHFALNDALKLANKLYHEYMVYKYAPNFVHD